MQVLRKTTESRTVSSGLVRVKQRQKYLPPVNLGQLHGNSSFLIARQK